MEFFVQVPPLKIVLPKYVVLIMRIIKLIIDNFKYGQH